MLGLEQHDAICEDGGIACLPFGKPVGTQFSGSLTVELAGNLSEWHGAMRGRSIGAYFGKPVSTSYCCSLTVGLVGNFLERYSAMRGLEHRRLLLVISWVPTFAAVLR